MLRLKEHRSNIQAVIRDDRISPNRRALLVALAMYFDADAESTQPTNKATPPSNEEMRRDKELLRSVIITQWGNPKNIQWTDYGEGGDPITTQLEIDTAKLTKEAFGFLEGKK